MVWPIAMIANVLSTGLSKTTDTPCCSKLIQVVEWSSSSLGPTVWEMFGPQKEPLLLADF